jgi:hypothetical protein
MMNTRTPSVQRTRTGWVALGPHFYVWQEDEASARMWLEALTLEPSPRPPGGDHREDGGSSHRPAPAH